MLGKITVCLCFAFAAAAISAQVSVQTKLDRPTVMAGETTALRVSISGGTPQTAENFPPIPGLTIKYQGHEQNVSIINGRSSFRHTLTYAVTPEREGTYQIPAITVAVEGGKYATQPVTLTATKADTTTENRYAFLRLLVPRNEVFVGELLPIEVQLYVTDADNLQAPQLTSDGFIIHKQAQHTRGQTQVGQIAYNVISFRMSISAVKAGKLTLGPAQMSMVLNIRARRDPNDVFGIFGRIQRRQMTVSSPEVAINVLPLPDGAPPEFTGAIGSFNWTVDANPKTVAVGDPITLRARVTGRGNFDNLKLPEFSWPDFKFYQPTSTVESNDPLGLEGAKVFEQVVIPQSPSVRELPSLSLAFFDPAKKEYVKLSQPSVPLTVKPSAASAAVPTIARTGAETEEPPAERTDIVHIKMEAGPLLALAPPLVNHPWFLALHALPLLAYAGFSLWRRRQDSLANNPRLRRKLQVQKTVRDGLAELRVLAGQNDLDAFYALVFRLLQEQLGERLDLPASAITEAVVDERLAARGAAPELIAQLHALFRLCNQARYAPVQTNAELLSIANDLEGALTQLQQLAE